MVSLRRKISGSALWSHHAGSWGYRYWRFRSDLEDCLTAIGNDRVSLCDPPGKFLPWSGEMVPQHIDDIGVTSTDRAKWVLQIMIYTDEGNGVCFKRNPSIRWSKTSHLWQIGDFRILNPMITILYKSNKQAPAEKEIHDIQLLIKEIRCPSG